MSTYTDLKNRVKENITVGYAPSDRTTLQKVKFHNEENEYWGTFSGSVIASKMTMTSCDLSGSVIRDSVIVDSVLSTSAGGVIDLSGVGGSIESLCADVSVLAQGLQQAVTDIHNVSSSVDARFSAYALSSDCSNRFAELTLSSQTAIAASAGKVSYDDRATRTEYGIVQFGHVDDPDDVVLYARDIKAYVDGKISCGTGGEVIAGHIKIDKPSPEFIAPDISAVIKQVYERAHTEWDGTVKNGYCYPVTVCPEYENDGTSSYWSVTTNDGLTFGDRDQLLLHFHKEDGTVLPGKNISLVCPDDVIVKNMQDRNVVYVDQLCAEQSARQQADESICAWISSNFDMAPAAMAKQNVFAASPAETLVVKNTLSSNRGIRLASADSITFGESMTTLQSVISSIVSVVVSATVMSGDVGEKIAGLQTISAAHDARISAIEADYLKSSDKSELVAGIAEKTQAKITSSAGTAEVFNEADGGGAKFTAADGTASFVGVNDPASAGSISGIAGQMYVVKDGRKTKLNMYDGRFCYVKGDNPTEADELAKREIAVMEDVLLVSSDMREADRTLSEQLADARATLAGVSADYLKSSDRTELSDAIALKADADDLTALAGTVNAISADYLKAVDKTELSDAILLKADQTTFELSVQTLESCIGAKADKTALDELSGAVGSISADYLKSADKAELSSAINLKADALKLETLAGTVNVVSSDYLKSADKTELAGAIATKADKTALELSVQALESAIGTKADKITLAELSGTLNAVSSDYLKSSDKTELSGAIILKADASTVTGIAQTLRTVSSDYLKSSDKAELAGTIATKADLTALNDYYTKSEAAGISSQIVAKDAVTVAKLATAEDTFFATYEVRQNGVKVGDSINIPKDFLVKSGEVKSCTEADKPISGLKPGDKYLDFTVNALCAETETEKQHIYIDVRDLADVYRGASTGTISVGVGSDNKISADIIAGSIGDDHLSSGCVTMPKLSEGVSSFVTGQYDNAVDYTDGEIDALSAVYLSKTNGGTVSAEMSVKGGLTIKDSSLFIPFRTGPYSNLSIGNTAFLIENVTGGGSSEITVSYPSVTGTMAVKSDVDNAIRALTKDISGAKSKTVTRVTETSGIISAQFEDILVQQSQVQGLTSDYWKKTETSSATQLADKFKTLSTYAETKAQLSSDGYATQAYVKTEDQALSNALTGVINATSAALNTALTSHTGNTSNPHGITAGQVNAYLCSQTSSNVQLKNKFDSLSTYADIKAKLSSDGYALTSNTSSVAELNAKFSQYALSNDVSSAGQLKTKFDSLSTYANIKSQLSVDGYALTSKTSSDIQLKNKFDTLSTYANIKTQLSVDGYALSSQVDKSAKDRIKAALTKAPALNTILTGTDSELLDNLDQQQIISVLIDIKKLFASLSA